MAASLYCFVRLMSDFSVFFGSDGKQWQQVLLNVEVHGKKFARSSTEQFEVANVRNSDLFWVNFLHVFAHCGVSNRKMLVIFKCQWTYLKLLLLKSSSLLRHSHSRHSHHMSTQRVVRIFGESTSGCGVASP